jgi:hypothetical protein
MKSRRTPANNVTHDDRNTHNADRQERIADGRNAEDDGG